MAILERQLRYQSAELDEHLLSHWKKGLIIVKNPFIK